MFGKLRLKLFGIVPEETTVARRGFDVRDDEVCANLEKIGRIFTQGYHTALLVNDPDEAVRILEDGVDSADIGFAYEGAAMGFALLDMLIPWYGNRVSRFIVAADDAHTYMIHVGVGWAMARIPRRVDTVLKRLDPMLKWLAIEGYGFHETYFNAAEIVGKQIRPKRLKGYAKSAFDQGIGRALWFTHGSQPERIAAAIATFAPTRRASLWSGVGLAAAYAGGVPSTTLCSLRRAADIYRPALAQGVIFATRTRVRADNLVEHTEKACHVICGISVDEAVRLCDAVEPLADADTTKPAYEVWRREIQNQFKITSHLVSSKQ